MQKRKDMFRFFKSIFSLWFVILFSSPLQGLANPPSKTKEINQAPDPKKSETTSPTSSDLFCKSRVNQKLKVDQKILKVEGMVCAFCIQGIEIHLKKLAAVKDITVNLEQGEVQIKIDHGQKITHPDLCEAIKRAGYRVTFVEHPPSLTDSTSSN